MLVLLMVILVRKLYSLFAKDVLFLAQAALVLNLEVYLLSFNYFAIRVLTLLVVFLIEHFPNDDFVQLV